MRPLPSHESSGCMRSGNQAVPMTLAPWDPEATAAFKGLDSGHWAKGETEKDRNSPCALSFVSDSRDREETSQ